MKKGITILLSIIFPLYLLLGQNIVVQPYLQDATPNSIRILWETDTENASFVEWGLTDNFGNISSGESALNEGTSRIYDVKLENLDRFTTYYYRVNTGDTASDVFSFKTPPFASDNESFRIIAMSDMQRDGNNPNKFQEIIEEGILDFIDNEVGGNLRDNVALVLIPGDLVATGPNYSHWVDQFFRPAQSLFSEVPVYPVLGNHEQNTSYYFNYFHLPENGTEGFEEHWWYKDYGNTRIIGLNSNSPYDSAVQLTWLEETLASTCSNEDVDFVFAELHHPHKSELWLPGESDFTGEVIERLEQFSTDCNKPSIHFFGHTHGYSRGQSRDHKHLWINVASAGGAIDNWGEFPQFDYDEFTVSHDDWGFVSVEVNAGENPSITVKRISRGNDVFPRNNELRDSFTIRKNAISIDVPNLIFPINETVIPECVVLKAGDFSSSSLGTIHGQSHWQVSIDCADFSEPIAESWKNFENYYYDINTQLEDNLTDERIVNLASNTNYCWRVRYRDRELNWSDWSEPAPFATSESQSPVNLLLNPGAEEDLDQWTAEEGVMEALTDGECDGIAPHSGQKFFAVGGVCEDGAYGKSSQDVDVSIYSDSIATGHFQANFGGYLSDYNGNDLPEMWLEFLSQSGEELANTAKISTLSSQWVMFSEWVDIPIGTYTIRFVLTGTRNSGADNDSYFDDLFLGVGREIDACSEYVVAINQPVLDIETLIVAPNPFGTEASIFLPLKAGNELVLIVKNVLGQEVACATVFESNRIVVQKGNLKAGTYFFVLKDNEKVIGNGRFLVK